MKLRIVALGNKLPAWVGAAYDDYARRLPRDFALELFEVMAEARGQGRTVAQLLTAEGARIAAATSGYHVVALDEHGLAWTTSHLAAELRRWRDDALSVAFVIGSADGLSSTIKRGAEAIVALSAFTLPHGLARVVLTEQLYRAVSLLQGHPYHRE